MLKNEKGCCRNSQSKQALQGSLILSSPPKQGQTGGTKETISVVNTESFNCSSRWEGWGGGDEVGASRTLNNGAGVLEPWYK